jgi:hypothetical protein
MRWTDDELVTYATMDPVSWDLFVMDLPADARTIDDIPGDFVGASLGSRAALIARIVEVEPGAAASVSRGGTTPRDGANLRAFAIPVGPIVVGRH